MLNINTTLIFADLSGYGLQLINQLDTWSIKFNIFAIRLEIYAIKLNKLTIKNSKLFDIDLNSDYASYYKQYNDLRLLIFRLTKNTIYDRSLYSLATIAAAALKKYCNEGFCFKTKPYDSLIRSNFFGGRKENFQDYNGCAWVFDFKNMYGNILQQSYPKEFIIENNCYIIDAPGFYNVKFSYDGVSKAPKLPVKYSNNTTYVSNGEGWYWDEELNEFINCGGSVLCLGSRLKAVQFYYPMKDLSEFLILQRDMGLKCAKKVLNSIYGRLAIKPSDKNTYLLKIKGANTDFIYDFDSYKKYQNFILYETTGDGTGSRVRSNIGWASIITSRGRLHLMRLIYSAETARYNILGVNTDCIWLDSKNKPIIDDSNLMQKTDFKNVNFNSN